MRQDLQAASDAVPALLRRAGAGTLRLLLIGHMDTVYPRGAVAARPFVIRFHWAFSVSAAIAAIGVFTSLTRGKDK
jgi:hypothetical protein